MYSNTLSYVLVGLFSSSSLAFASNTSVKVIYGEDNREDYYQASNQYQKWADATAAMIPNDALRAQANGTWSIHGQTLSDRGVCESERFSEQTSAALCSGFLVSKTQLVTAGHCIQNQNDCNAHKWVLGYRLNHSSQTQFEVSNDAVYACKKIVSRKLESSTGTDYALIELDKEVVDVEPLELRESGKPSVGQELVVIGHPSGLPTKIAAGAQVRSLTNHFLVANLDTFGGNSGSAVINIATGKVEGILVRGDTDYVRGPSENCVVANVLGNNAGRGEDVTLISEVEGIVKDKDPSKEEGARHQLRENFSRWLHQFLSNRWYYSVTGM